MSDISDKLNTLSMEEPNKDIIELLDYSKTPKTYTDLVSVGTIFNRTYYKVPLKLINDEIKLLDENQKEIPYDFRTILVKPFDIKIKTFYNENNRDILTDKVNKTIAMVAPKYEHYINFSKDNVLITCLPEQKPVKLTCVEINAVHKLIKSGKLLKETLMF